MEFNIRKNAMLLLAHIYQNCDISFKVENLEVASILPNRKHRWQSRTYLRESGFISEHDNDKECSIITTSITLKGINAIEDYSSANPHFDKDGAMS